MSDKRRTIFLSACALASLAASPACQVTGTEHSSEVELGSHAPVRCERVVFRVALEPGGPADQDLVAHLCARGSIQHKTIQILIHGASYDHNYWDWPQQPERYSYVHAITKAGYAVLNLDRIGHGESSRPPDGFALNLHTAAFTVHQVVQKLRGGQLRVAGFGRVKGQRIQLVGFSLGSFISTIEASTYDDVDGILLSAYSHTVGPVGETANDTVYPADFDPKFAGQGLPLSYVTTMPGTRAELFYHVPGADPAVIAVDETLKQTITIGELADIFPSFGASTGVHVPTLVVVGDHDFISCNQPSCTDSDSLSNEASFFPPDSCVEVEVVPDSGHSLNLHTNAREWFAIARAWSDRWIGPSTKRSPPASCD